MTCTSCPSPTVESCPPYANLHSVEMLKEIICTECSATVPANTPKELFSIVGFQNNLSSCCDIFYVFEGTSLWLSEDGISWSEIGANTVQTRTQFFSEVKADSLSGNFNVSSIPTGYDSLEFVGRIKSATTNNFYIHSYLNGDLTNTNYDGESVVYRQDGSIIGSTALHTQAGIATDPAISLSNTMLTIYIRIMRHENTSYYKGVYAYSKGVFSDALGWIGFKNYYMWKNTAAITSFDLYLGTTAVYNSGLFAVGSTLEGYAIKD